MIFLLRSHPTNSVRRGSLRSDWHQGCPGEQGVCRTGRDGDSLSDWGGGGGLSEQEIPGDRPRHLRLFPLQPQVSLRGRGLRVLPQRTGLCCRSYGAWRSLSGELPGLHHGGGQTGQCEEWGGPGQIYFSIWEIQKSTIRKSNLPEWNGRFVHYIMRK